MRFKLTIAYDGTDFSGWQVQPDEPSIAQMMQQTFKRLFDHDITLIGASRTDAGVHALGQVAVFSTDLTLEPAKLMEAWNDALPPTIVVRSMELVPDKFHPIYKVAEKIYWYHFFLRRPLPFVERYGWFVRFACDINQLEQALSIFVGTHDFRSFCTGTDMGANTVRTIDSIELEELNQFRAWRIVFKGPGFMRHMIRRIAGASMQVATKEDLQVTALKDALGAKDPRQTLLNAPAKGLCLDKIRYRE